MKAYEAIGQSLIAEGMTDFFGLMGDGNMWLWASLCRDPSIKAYHARHESMAVSMADGYARTTGKVGVAMVTCGPGLTQCGTSLIVAYLGTGAGNRSRQHVVIEGDGSLMFNLQELETIVRHKMQMVLIVWNDAGYGAEVHKLVAKGFDEKLAQWESPDFVALAKAFGGDGVKLATPSDIGGAIAEGLRKGGLYLIDARVSPTTPTDPYAKVHFGIESHAPLLRPVA